MCAIRPRSHICIKSTYGNGGEKVAKVHTGSSFSHFQPWLHLGVHLCSGNSGYVYNVTLRGNFFLKNMQTVTRQNMRRKYAELGHERGTKNIKNFQRILKPSKWQFMRWKCALCTLLENMLRSHIHVKPTCVVRPESYGNNINHIIQCVSDLNESVSYVCLSILAQITIWKKRLCCHMC